MPKQRISPRAPLHLKPTACSEANSLHRPAAERSPKLDDRRSPHSPLHEKKKGSRVADLETKLGQAQEELMKLKEQLAEAEAAKRDAQMELEESKKFCPFTPASEDDEKEKTINIEEEQIDEEAPIEEKDEALAFPAEEESANSPTTDVFEMPPANSEGDGSKHEEEEGTETKGMVEEESSKEEAVNGEKVEEEEEEVESKMLVEKDAEECPEMVELRAILAGKEKKLKSVEEENESLKMDAEEAKAESSAASEKVGEMMAKLTGAEEELSESREAVERLREKLEAEEGVKASLEAELKRMRVQTDQWRKAAEAAASVLCCGAELNGRRVGESCRSMEKNLRGYDISEGCGGWSPVISGGDGDDGIGGGKRRGGGGGGGIRMFGDLWKRKGQQK